MSDLDEIRQAAEKAKKALAARTAGQPSLKDRVMKAFRAGHAQCGVWRWLPEKGTFAPIEVDTRCSFLISLKGALNWLDFVSTANSFITA